MCVNCQVTLILYTYTTTTTHLIYPSKTSYVIESFDEVEIGRLVDDVYNDDELVKWESVPNVVNDPDEPGYLGMLFKKVVI